MVELDDVSGLEPGPYSHDGFTNPNSANSSCPLKSYIEVPECSKIQSWSPPILELIDTFISLSLFNDRMEIDETLINMLDPSDLGLLMKSSTLNVSLVTKVIIYLFLFLVKIFLDGGDRQIQLDILQILLLHRNPIVYSCILLVVERLELVFKSLKLVLKPFHRVPPLWNPKPL